MGKRYFCDYCNKTMVAKPSILKTHNSGLSHQRLVLDHYQQYKDAETILAEESKKKPCLRYANGECVFGYMCRFSHYSLDQLAAFRNEVAAKSQRSSNESRPSFGDLYEKLQLEKLKKTNETDEDTTVIYDHTGVTHTLPWTYMEELMSYGENLPLSMKKFQIEDFTDVNIVEWG